MPNAIGTACPAHRSPFTLTRVDDKRGYANNRNVGFTQTGLFNVKASLETEHPTVSQDTASSPARIDVAFEDIATRQMLHTPVQLTAK